MGWTRSQRKSRSSAGANEPDPAAAYHPLKEEPYTGPSNTGDGCCGWVLGCCVPMACSVPLFCCVQARGPYYQRLTTYHLQNPGCCGSMLDFYTYW